MIRPAPLIPGLSPALHCDWPLPKPANQSFTLSQLLAISLAQAVAKMLKKFRTG